jgi:polyisoprenoid-binding protein YceI
MPARSEQLTTPALQALLKDGTLAGDWALDPSRTSIRLKTRSMSLITVRGIFREVTGTGTITPGGAVSGTLAVAAASIDTGNPRRDVHLRSADFFDSDSHPDITFAAESARPSGQGVTITGTLTIRGQTRPLPVNAAVSVRGDGEVGLDAEVRINRADFGITWNALGLVSMDNTLTIHATFTAAHLNER